MSTAPTNPNPNPNLNLNPNPNPTLTLTLVLTLTLNQVDCADLAPSTKLAPGGESLIVSNPPWGMRLDGPESEEARRRT